MSRMDEETASKGATTAADEQLSQLTGKLLETLQQGGAKSIEIPLEQIYHYFREKTWKQSSNEALLQTWSACALLLDEDLTFEACTRTLHILRSLSQFCTHCGTPVFQDCSQLDVGALVTRIAACMKRYPDAITLQTNACALISRLSGCSSCQQPSSTDLVAAVQDAGAVQALAQAITSLQAHSSVPASMVCAAEALTALRMLGGQPAASLDIVNAGGVDLITTARDLAQGQGSSPVHAMMLLGQLAYIPESTFEDALRAANAAIDTAQAISNVEQAAQNQQYSNGVRMMWCITSLVEDLSKRPDVDTAALSSCAERNAAIAVAYLSRPDMDQDVALIWMRLLHSLVCCVSRQDTSGDSPTITSPATAQLIASTVLHNTQSPSLHSALLSTLWNLLSCCKKPLDTATTDGISIEVAMSINKTLLKFEQPDILGTRPVDGACLIYGLACLGALGTYKDHVCPELAVVAVSDALSVLTDAENKNRLFDANCTAEWDTTQITWASLSIAVRVTVEILLAAGTQALNAAYVDDGFNLMHILAADGQSKCLKIVLQMCGGDCLDLLARTKSGATALQLARQNKHTAAADLLEEVTQRAAEARQAALLEEIEAADKDDSARKAKKKKSVTRSASFAAQQPDEKSQKTDTTATDHHHQQSQGVAELASEEDAAASAAEQARVELRQRLEEEYELALEERRMELAKQQQQQHDQQIDHSMQTNSGEDSSSAENPSTPRAMLEAGLTTGGNNGDSANGGTGSGSNSNSGAEDDLMMLIGGSLDAAIAAPAATGSFLGEGNAMLRRTPSSAILSPHTMAPSVPLPNGARSDLNNMAINGLGMLGANSFDHGAAATGGGNGSSIQREHSLFGSPTLTGSLFGTGSYGSGSPGFSTGLHAGGGASAFGNETSGTTQQQLPDALFIHHGLSTEETLNQSNNASFLSGLAGTNHVVPQMNSAYGQRVPSIGGGSANTGGSGSSDGDSDASSEPTRHLWIGNLGTRTPRAVLKAVFETHGIVEDVVTFPGRMYAFVNFCTTEEAIQATNVLQNQVVPELTGDRPLLLKYRPVKKAEMHLRSLVGDSMLDGSDLQHIGGLVSSAVGGGHGFGSSGGLSALGKFGSSSSAAAAGLRSPGLVGGLMMPGNGVNSSVLPADLDGNCSDPSPRIWLGNIAPTATSKTLQAVLGRFGLLTDAAVFPARIGPLGYAFVKFEALEDAIRALETLNNTVVPPLSGSKQLKMRYKPAASGPAGREESMNDSSKSQTMPSRHLWLGNITQKPTEDIIFQAFAKFGRVDSARVFPAKAYAFVNFSDINAAVRAMTEMEGVCIPCLTGVKPLVMRFQQENQQQPTGPPPVLNPMLRASNSLANVAGLASAFNNPHMSRVQSDSALALAASLNQLVPGAGAPGLSDDHPHGLVGVVPNNTNSSTPATWSPEQASQMHRSASLNLLSHNGAAGTPAPSPFGPSMLGSSSSDHHHHHSSSNNGSASSSQLSAVLNNLAALQRAASIGGGAAAAPGTGNNAPAHQDIASLSTMLASQSLASEVAMRPCTATGNVHGWNSSTANGLDGLLCPLSKQLMTDPVLAADGVTYNKPAISEWLASQTISPVLQTPLPHGGLVPNHAVKDAVLGYLRMQLRVAA